MLYSCCCINFDPNPILNGIAKLKAKRTPFQDGLTDDEIERIQARFKFVFPPELRFFLQTAVPSKEYYVPWRGKEAQLAEWFSWVEDGVLFDVEQNHFWYPAWGERPASREEALVRVREELKHVPMLIPIGDPIYHKCIPELPTEPGNPIFSIHQTDILHAGRDLGDYLRWLSRSQEEVDRDEELDIEPTPVFSEDYRAIPFWTDLTRDNTGPPPRGKYILR